MVKPKFSPKAALEAALSGLDPEHNWVVRCHPLEQSVLIVTRYDDDGRTVGSVVPVKVSEEVCGEDVLDAAARICERNGGGEEE